ncbi:MAG: hypothetical protein GX759_07775 [Thermoanaerobacterales bacterium]|jgi:hypothetical protein|nr:hypothetical protein [Thermoanaerobacterales bacterium]
MVFKETLLNVILLLSVLLCGYAFGRRVGVKQGIEQGKYTAIIDIKRKMFYTSSCPICSSKLNTSEDCDNIHNREAGKEMRS